MSDGYQFLNHLVHAEFTGEFEVPDEAGLQVESTREFSEDKGEQMPVSDVDELIPAASSSADTDFSVEDGMVPYLRQISKTPLLTRVEETQLFEQFSAKTQRIDELLNTLPPSILDHVKSQSNRRRKAKPKSVHRWWTPMEIGGILELISTEIRVCQNGQTEETPDQRDAIETLWSQLTTAVEEMTTVREKIIRANLLLVASVVMQYRAYTASMTLLDLMQEGNIGLMKAVEKFDLQKKCKFSTYAYWWIMQAVQRALAQQSRTIRLPCYIGTVRQSIAETQTRLSKELNREPAISEIALAMGMAESRVVEILQSGKGTISLDSPLFDSNDTTVSDTLADESSVAPDKEVLNRSARESLDKALNTLTWREKIVIQLRFGLTDGTEYTLAEIGQQLGISRERVRQIQEEVLHKFRHPIHSKSLEELL